MRLIVEHVTQYSYDQPMRGVVQSHRLRPSVFEGQRTLSWEVSVENGIKGGSFRDGAGDVIDSWSVAGPVRDITVTVRGEVETSDLSGLLKGHREIIPPAAYLRDTQATQVDAALAALSDSVSSEEGQLALAHGLCAAVADAIKYTAGATSARTTAAEALAIGEGVCQDHAHALIACARHRDLPARYVSGYLHTDADGVAHDAAHAWAEIWIEGLGWVGFDPANRCCPDARYIRLGSGLDAALAAPIRGVARGPGTESMVVRVAIAETASQQSQQ